MDSVPGSGRSPQVGTGNPLQYSCLGNFMGSGASWAAEPHGPQSLMGHGVAESDTTEYTHRLQMLYSANKNFFLVNLRSRAGYSPRGHRVGHNSVTERQQYTRVCILAASGLSCVV